MNIKYKLEINNVLRPYLCLAAGITIVINFNGPLIGTRFLELPDEKTGYYSTGTGMAGMDFWISRKLAVFIEERYNISNKKWSNVVGLRVR